MIEISDNDCISTIIIAIRDKHTDRSFDKQQDLARTALLESGYGEEGIEPWLNAFDEL